MKPWRANPLLAIVGNPPPSEYERMRRVEEAQHLAQLAAWREEQGRAESELARFLAHTNPGLSPEERYRRAAAATRGQERRHMRRHAPRSVRAERFVLSPEERYRRAAAALSRRNPVDPRLERLVFELEAADPYAADPWGDEPPGWEPPPPFPAHDPAAIAAYEARQEAKRERLERAAARARGASQSAWRSSHAAVAGIPPGQPILRGHHSERRHRRAIERSHAAMRRSIEEERRAADLAARAAAVGTGGISSDDPAAVVKLVEKLKALEQRRDHMKAVNKRVRAAAKKLKLRAKDVRNSEQALQILEAAGVEGRELAGLLQSFQIQPYHGVGYPSYNLTNTGAEIRRVKKRIEALRREYARPEQVEPEIFEGFEVIENREINRIQIVFDGKPGKKTRDLLKRSGFRWSRREGAWQRQLNEAGRSAARRVANEITGSVHGGWTQNPDPAGSLVFNAYSSETRWYPLPPTEAAATALLEDLPGHPLPPAAEVAGHVRVGPWFAKLTANPKKRGRPSPFWHQLLDTIRYSLYDLQNQQTSPGIASITASQWQKFYPRIRAGKGKVTAASAEKAWKRFLKQIREQDRAGAGIEAAKQSGWLHINVANAFDAAWRATGELHELGERRELELAPGRRSEIEESYAWLEEAPPPVGEWIPEGYEAFGGVEAFESAKRAARRAVAPAVHPGRIGVSANPQERKKKPPRVTKHRLDEFEDHPGYDESWDKFERFHDSDPGEVDVWEIEDGSDEETWAPVHWAMHEDLETRYVVPWESNKDQNYWVHKHRSSKGVQRPLRVGHPFQEDTTMTILRGSVVDDWWHS